MKFFNKAYILLPVLALCMAFGPLAAGPFDTDMSDWSSGESGLCTKGEFDNLNYVVERYRKKIGVKAPVEIVEGKENAAIGGFKGVVEKDGDCSKPHLIELDSETHTLLNASFLSRVYRSTERYKAIGSLCHELGHARQEENPKNIATVKQLVQRQEEMFEQMKLYVSRIEAESSLQKKDDLKKAFYDLLDSHKKLLGQLDHLKYEQELEADDAVLMSNDKRVLKARRDFLCLHHEKLYAVVIDEKLRAIKYIDFTQSMNEAHAQMWDEWHQRMGDCHPSSFRRAHLANKHLEALKAQNRELCEKIAKHVEFLTTSDLM